MSTIINMLVRLAMDSSGFAQAAKQASSGVGDIKKNLDSLEQTGRTMRNVGAGITAGVTVPIIALVTKSTMAAARVDELDLVVNTLGKTSGYTEKEISKHVKSVEKMGIESAAAREIVANFVTAQLNAADASKIARVAQDQAVIAGENSTETTNRLTAAIITGNAQMFRSLRMNIDLTEGYKVYANQIGKTVGELTEQEKVQARVNAVMEYGTTITGTYEAAMADSYKQMGSFKRYLDDIFVALGQHFTPALNIAVFAIGDFLKEVKNWVSEGGKLEASLKTLGNVLEGFAVTLKGVLEWFTELPPWILNTVVQLGAFLAILGPIALVGGQAIVMVSELGTAMSAAATSVGVSTAAFAPWLVAIGLAVTAVMDFTGKVNSLSKDMREMTDEAIAAGKSFEEYQKQVEKANKEMGVWDKILGTSYNVTRKFVEDSLKELKDTVWLTEDSYKKLMREIRRGNLDLEDALEIVYKLREQYIKYDEWIKLTTEDLSEYYELVDGEWIPVQIRSIELTDEQIKQHGEIIDLYEKLSSSVGDYTVSVSDLEAEAYEVWKRFQELQANPYRTDEEQQELEDLRIKYANLQDEIDNTISKHSEMAIALILDYAKMKLAADGWTEESMINYIKVLEAFGEFDEESAAIVSSIVSEYSLVEEGLMDITDWANNAYGAMMMMDKVKTSSYHTNYIRTLYTGEDWSDVAGGYYEEGRVTPRASGGPVTAGMPYLVGERGPEWFVPDRSGEIIPNDAPAMTENNYYMTVQTSQSPTDVITGFDLMKAFGGT